MVTRKRLQGRTALLTGVSRRSGIGYGILRRLLDEGARVFATGWSAHDAEMPWGEDPSDASEFPSERVAWVEADLSDANAPAHLISQTVERFGHIDLVIANGFRRLKAWRVVAG